MNGGRGIEKGCLLVFFVKGARTAIVNVLTVLETQNLEPNRTILFSPGAMATATVAVAVAAMATSMAWMVTAMAAVAAMATAMAAVTTINSKEAATAVAEELDDGRDGRRLCSVLFVIFSVAFTVAVAVSVAITVAAAVFLPLDLLVDCCMAPRHCCCRY
jgi:hypothetical protein